MSQFLGLDVGTQGTKGLVIDVERGAVVARAARSYGLLEGLSAGAAEQHPETWWSAVRDVARELAGSPEVERARLRGVGVSGQQHGFVALDGAGEVIRPAKLWCDTQTAAEARELSQAFGRNVPTGYTAAKILWLKRHEPERFARLATVLLPHDYVNLRLTGRAWMEAGDASGTGFFDPVERRFVADEVAHIDAALPERLPALVAPDEVAGELSPAAAAELDLPAGLAVAPGGGDNMLSAIGSGAVAPGVCVLSLGTSGTVFTFSQRPVIDPAGLIAPFCDSTGGWLPLLCVMNVTGVTEEVHRACAGSHDLDALTRAAEDVPAGCDGLLFLPYLQGERVPDLPEATGTLLGLRPGDLAPARLFRAALEGTSLNLAWGVERLRAQGITLDRVRLVGGGARNPLWCRILADVLGLVGERLEEPESAALGGALQAAWVCGRREGATASLPEVVRPFVRVVGEPVEPDPERVERYGEVAQRFREAVDAQYGVT